MKCQSRWPEAGRPAVTKIARIAPGHGGRLVQEWIGKSPDDRPPPRVRLRIFKRAKGLCHISGRKIRPGDPWELEHKIPLHAGGENRESNLAPAITSAHKVKTAEEAAKRSKTDRVAEKHLGVIKPKGTIKARGFSPPEPKERSDRFCRIDKSTLPPLPRRNPLTGEIVR